MNQSQRLKKFRETLQKYNPNETLIELDKIEMIKLFENHPNWKIKKGVGIKNIKVILDYWKRKAFILERIDGSSTDISIITSAKGKSDNDLQRIKNACRFHITPEILKFKDSIDFSNYKCPITGKLLQRDNCHIDHYELTFEELFNNWIVTKDVNEISKYLNDHTKDNVVQDMFVNKDIIIDFVTFHNNNTKLRAVSQEANLSILRRKNNDN